MQVYGLETQVTSRGGLEPRNISSRTEEQRTAPKTIKAPMRSLVLLPSGSAASEEI